MKGLESTVSVFKRQRAGGTGSYLAAASFTWKCHIDPDGERLELREALVQSTHIMLGGPADIAEGDRIEEGSDVYFIQGVQSFRTPHQSPHHLQIYVTRRE